MMNFKFKSPILLFVYLVCSCNNSSGIPEDSDKSLTIDHLDTALQNHSEILTDSATSFINLPPNTQYPFMKGADITNVNYSMKSFYYKDTLRYYICKSKIEETGVFANSHGSRKEKIEFFDYQLTKQFEINAKQRKIELKQAYFMTQGLFTDYPSIFELNSYETNTPFVKCTGSCWTVDIPNGETKAYFGYQAIPGSQREKLNQLGTLYFAINERSVSKIDIFYPENQKYHSLISLYLVPKNEQDRINHSYSEIKNLTLRSQNGNSGKAAITGFDILIKFRREKQDKSNQYENIDYLINVKNGTLKGKGLKLNSNGYQLQLL